MLLGIKVNLLRQAAAAGMSLQLCLTLCDPIDGSPPGSPVPEILQVRTLEWVAISFSNAWKWKMEGKLLSHVWLFATLWTAAYQAPLSMGFSRQQYWSELPLPSPYYSKVTLLILNFKKRNISGMKEFIVWRRKQRVTDRMMPTKKGLYLCKSCPLNCSCKIGAVAISDTLKILTLALMG